MDSTLLRQHLELEETHWWFAARRKILLDVLRHHLGEANGKVDILDVGCGGGLMMESLRLFGRTRGLELVEEAVEYNRSQGRDVVQGVIEKIPHPDNTFDVALALDVIEHVPDDSCALRELHRVVRPGGLLLVTVPALEILWGKHDVANGHYRRYTVTSLSRNIRKSGFDPVKTTYFNTLLFPPILSARLLQRFKEVKATSDVSETPEPWNSLLKNIFSLETRLVERLDLPVGVSALCLARKAENDRTV